MKWIVLVLFGAVGLAALVGGGWWAAKRYEIVQNGEIVTALVVDQVEHTSTKTRGRLGTDHRTTTSYYPLVEFRTEDDQVWRFEGTTGGGGNPILPTGTEVFVLYHRDDPNRAIIVDFQQAWLGPLVLAVAGAVFLSFGVGGFFLIGGSDRHFERLHETMRRDARAFREDTVRFPATITHVRQLSGKDAGKYVLVCQGLRPGERFKREYQSEHFDFEPDRSVVGRDVQVLADPQDRKTYQVELGAVLKEILERRG